MIYIKEFKENRVVLSDGTILTCDKSKGESFNYDILKKILEHDNKEKTYKDLER